MNIKNGKKVKRKGLGTRCSLNSLSSSVQKGGGLSLCLNKAACSRAGEIKAPEGQGARAEQTLAFSDMSMGRGLGSPALQGVVLTGDVQVGVGLDLPALVTGEALEDS